MRGLMSPREAEKFLGLTPSHQGRALLRFALRKEQQTGKQFIIRSEGKTKHGARYRFTRELLRRNLPELWEGRFERVTRRVAAAVDKVKEHIDSRIDERIEKHPLVQELVERSDSTIELVESLTEQVERMVGTKRNQAQPSDSDQVGGADAAHEI